MAKLNFWKSTVLSIDQPLSTAIPEAAIWHLKSVDGLLQAVTSNAHSTQGESRKCMEKLNAFTADVYGWPSLP